MRGVAGGWRLGGLALVLVLAAHGARAADAAGADKIKVSIPVFSEVGYAPFYLAIDKGYFAEEKLDVELIGAGGGIATPALISGDMQFSGSPGAAIGAILKGAPLKVVYVGLDRPPYQLWASDPAIRTLADLKGRQVGVVSRGDTHELSVRLLLMAQHIDPNAVAFTALGFGGGRVAALNSGALPAASLTREDIGQLKDAPNLHMVADTWSQVRMVTGGLAANDRSLHGGRPLATRFMRGLMKGVRYMLSFEDGTVEAMVKHNPTVSRDNTAKVYRAEIAGMTMSGDIAPAVQQQMVALYADLLGIAHDQARPVTDIFDFSLVAEVNRALDTEHWTPRQ